MQPGRSARAAVRRSLAPAAVAVVAALAVLGASAAPLRAQVQPTYTKIIDTNGPYDGPSDVNAINNSGTVVFYYSSPEGTGQHMAISNGGPVTVLARRDDPAPGGGTFSNLNSESINDAGAVGFRGFVTNPNGHGAYIRTGSGSTVRVAGTGGAITGVSSAFLNAGGSAAYLTQFSGGAVSLSRYNADGSPVTPIADTNGPLSGIGLPDLNDAGTIAFGAAQDAGGAAIYTSNGGALATVADTSGPYSQLGGASLNNAGTVAFSAGFDDSSPNTRTAIVTRTAAGSSHTVADTAGRFSSFPEAFSLNDAGQVAFKALLDGGGEGIYLAPDSPGAVPQKIIETGDPLFGGTVTGVRFAEGGLNDAGQVVFWYVLEGGAPFGVQGIAVATVPEPAALSLAALLAPLLLRRLPRGRAGRS